MEVRIIGFYVFKFNILIILVGLSEMDFFYILFYFIFVDIVMRGFFLLERFGFWGEIF